MSNAGSMPVLEGEGLVNTSKPKSSLGTEVEAFDMKVEGSIVKAEGSGMNPEGSDMLLTIFELLTPSS
jgi:hypothetical protein